MSIGEELQGRLQLQIYDWIQAEMPAWQPDRSPRYQHESQALTAAIPEGAQSPTPGLVYFKSPFDPCWSNEDLARLEKSAYPWILMILNPYERFYEFGNRLAEIAGRLNSLRIWRPDAPSRTETDSLRALLLDAPARAGQKNSASEETLTKIRSMLADLYINRGRMIRFSRQRPVFEEIGDRTLSRYLSACLDEPPQQRTDGLDQGAAASSKADQTGQALYWARLLAGGPGPEDGGADRIRETLAAWWTGSVGRLFTALKDLPEPFRTTRVARAIKQIENPYRALEPVFQDLLSQSGSLPDAMARVGHAFEWSPERLLKWKQGLEDLGHFAAWLQGFAPAWEYLNASFPLGSEPSDLLRASLIQSVEEPGRFFEARARREFDQKFLEFKRIYTDSYCLLHEDALRVMGGAKNEGSRVDTAALRNLDLLSGLQHTDKLYLNRVKLLARWVQYSQCNLPLREILEHTPRCYCNFNPCDNPYADSVARINGIIQDGIDYFRKILRRCGYLIMEEIRVHPIDDSNLKQITAALSDGAMLPLNAQSIKILNRIIGKYPNEFVGEIRQVGKPAGPAH